MKPGRLVLAIREQRRGDIKIVYVIDLVPELSLHWQRHQFVSAHENQDFQHFLIIFIQAIEVSVRDEERDESMLAEGFGELVDVHGLEVGPRVDPGQLVTRQEPGDSMSLVEDRDRTVHPGLELGNDGEIGSLGRDAFL